MKGFKGLRRKRPADIESSNDLMIAALCHGFNLMPHLAISGEYNIHYYKNTI
jgi:hypothetical protein